MTMASDLIDDVKLKMACHKIADGIADLQRLGLKKEQVMNGIQAQVNAFFRDDRKEADQR